jgi:hypothetical protein
MTRCWQQASGSVELLFYGELSGAERDAMAQHVRECSDCARTLDELKVIRAALETRPKVSAPEGGDWARFMARLEDAIQQPPAEPPAGDTVAPARVQHSVRRLVSIAALLALVTLLSVYVALRQPTRPSSNGAPAELTAVSETPVAQSSTAGPDERKDPGTALTQLSERHFDRSKLVVLSLVNKDPQGSDGMDWDYERQLAGSLLSDTRVYRQAAEERGMRGLADVMRDLELVLLQTSMSETPDAESLAQLQRLIRRRDLVTKMDVVKTGGLVP